MVKSILVDVDFNGIVLFDYPGILTIFDEEINDRENILHEFTNKDKGDVVLDKGIALPIMGIDDGTYLVRIFINETPEEKKESYVQ